MNEGYSGNYFEQSDKISVNNYIECEVSGNTITITTGFKEVNGSKIQHSVFNVEIDLFLQMCDSLLNGRVSNITRNALMVRAESSQLYTFLNEEVDEIEDISTAVDLSATEDRFRYDTKKFHMLIKAMATVVLLELKERFHD